MKLEIKSFSSRHNHNGVVAAFASNIRIDRVRTGTFSNHQVIRARLDERKREPGNEEKYRVIFSSFDVPFAGYTRGVRVREVGCVNETCFRILQ